MSDDQLDDEKQNELAAEAASEPGDTHPVFGSAAQPQEVYDEELVGTKEGTESLKGEDTVVDFDPENDARMQEPSDVK